MIKLKIYLIAAICSLLLISSCTKDDASTAPKITDQEMADLFAWAVKISVKWVAPSSETQTWSNTSVSGYESGSAIVNGSFTYNYDVNSGQTDKTYNNVVIQFDNYCDDSYYPHLTGTVIINGTCTTRYGWSTTYSGSWELAGVDLRLSGKLSGKASIAMLFKNGGSDWAAIVETTAGTWSVTN